MYSPDDPHHTLDMPLPTSRPCMVPCPLSNLSSTAHITLFSSLTESTWPTSASLHGLSLGVHRVQPRQSRRVRSNDFASVDVMVIAIGRPVLFADDWEWAKKREPTSIMCAVHIIFVVHFNLIRESPGISRRGNIVIRTFTLVTNSFSRKTLAHVHSVYRTRSVNSYTQQPSTFLRQPSLPCITANFDFDFSAGRGSSSSAPPQDCLLGGSQTRTSL